MPPNDDITSRILESLSTLPPGDQVDVILTLISAAMKSMSLYRLLEIRADIAAELNPTLPLVNAALELIDGQIALREIAGDADWR